MDQMITPPDIFPWNANFETGITVVDKQHHQLVNLLNKLVSRLAYEADTEELNQVFEELNDYTLMHFKTEEGVWKKYLLDDELPIEHEMTHRAFVTEVDIL
jgi:hemerythrin-like metal-binding protein